MIGARFAAGYSGGRRMRQSGKALVGLILILLVGAIGYLLREHWLGWLPENWGAALRGMTGTPSTAAEPARIYAWQNDAGQWQYTDEPPTDRPFELRQYREDTNVVPAFKPPAD